MKKIFLLILLSIFFSGTTFADSYYFKTCKLSSVVIGDYSIDFDKNVINVKLQATDGTVQTYSDKIKLIEKDKIISEKIKSQKDNNIYFQYFLNSKSKTVTKLQYKKESGIDMDVFKLDQKRESNCANVKADWNENKIKKIEKNKEQKNISEAQKKLKKEQSALIVCKGKDHKKWTNCKGKYKSENGLLYNGLFKSGKMIKGSSIYPGGAKYFGEFENYEPHGYGTFIWANGDKYYGEWRNGKSHGTGTKIWKDGRKYSGAFKNDKLHGEGTLFYPDGEKYVGEFINGKRHGEGTFTYSDGTAYIGKFIEGKEEGIGECVNKEGLSVACENRIETQAKSFSGKDTRTISITAKKRVRISQYESNTKKGKQVMDKLKQDFEVRATELCASKGSYNVLEKKIEVLEIDDTPSYGLETVVRLGISGVIECK